MAAQLCASDALDRVQVVTWAPTTTPRRRARGFDHAELLARGVARSVLLPARAALRRRPGPPQTGLSRRARRSGPCFDLLDARLPSGVLLVDDVATTGATVSAAAAALRSGGAHFVVVSTAARTPRSQCHAA
jgi:predicted amidophosphoribosyltransferase